MICSDARRVLPALALLALLTACGGAAAPRNAADLTNPFLGPEYTSWLVGAVSRIATPEEVQGYLAVRDDAAAEAFIRQFWERRDPSPELPGNAVLDTFNERSAQADKAFSEAGYLGRRTDRGTIHVVYGPPTESDYDVLTAGVPLEVWTYGAKAPVGLDGKRPAGSYRFVKRGDLTVLYLPGQSDPRLRNRPGVPPGGPPGVF